MTTRMSRARGICLGMALTLVVVGCGSSSATPTPDQTPVPTEAASASQLLASFLAATDSAAPAVSTATAAPTATPTPATEPSAAASASAAPAATNDCTGTADNKAFFSDTTSLARFPLYCAVLPSDWWLQEASYDRSNKALMAAYLNGRHFIAELIEGQICLGECKFPDQWNTGRKIWFGDLGAYLYYVPELAPVADPAVAVPSMPPLTEDSMGLFLAVAPYSQTVSYALMAEGMSLGTFTKLAKAVIRVPNS